MIIDVTDATFEADVLQRSMTTPVVIDLWAAWCGPCKTLTPILEKVIGETNGKVVLAKVDVDQNPQISQAFRVQSIPAVYALADGQVVANFMGAQPEAQVRAFVGELLGDALGDEVSDLVAAGDEESLRKALDLDASSRVARALLARLLMEDERVTEAIAVLEAAPEPDPEIEAMLEVVRAAAVPPSRHGEIDARLGELLGSVKEDEAARAEFLSLLDELAAGDPEATAAWRKKLSIQLF
jgi:putative thioredoxin